jgi:hypothetical protein
MADTLVAPAASPYVARVLGRLGDRDPFQVQEALAGSLRAAAAGLDDAELRRPEAPGKWSVIQVVQHLADTEMVYGYRLRLVLAHDNPDIQGVDQDAWAARLRYHDAGLEDALAQLAALRAANLRLAASLDEEEWERTGLHSERGPESARLLFRLAAGHDLVHLDQIARIRRAIGRPLTTEAWP